MSAMFRTMKLFLAIRLIYFSLGKLPSSPVKRWGETIK